MRRPLVLAVIFVGLFVSVTVWLLVTARHRSPANDQIMRRACGTAKPEVEILVFDPTSKCAVSDAEVTFYDQRDLVQFMMIDAAQRSGRKDVPNPPSGSHARTDSNGRATLRCSFAFTELTFASGAERSELYPEGRFRVTRIGYSECDVEARALLPTPPYVTALPLVKIAMKKADQTDKTKPANR